MMFAKWSCHDNLMANLTQNRFLLLQFSGNKLIFYWLWKHNNCFDDELYEFGALKAVVCFLKAFVVSW